MSLTQNEYVSTLQLVSSISDRCKTIESLGTAIKYEKVMRKGLKAGLSQDQIQLAAVILLREYMRSSIRS
ncbi:MAG: hypothetical protein WCR20_13035 [Verrucomicrobiota bacterium]